METRFAVAIKADASKDEHAISIVTSIGHHQVRPSRAGQYSMHGQGDPNPAIYVEDANVIKGNILGAREYAVISPAVNEQEHFLICIF